MRDQVNEIYAQLRERDMRRIGEKRQLENLVSQTRGKPFYAPMLAYVGMMLSRLGAMLQARYERAPEVTYVVGETVRE